MVPHIPDALVSEPNGRPISLVWFGSLFVYLCAFVYFSSVGELGDVWWLMFFLVVTALLGIAESLPKDRRQQVGVLRSVAILILIIMIIFALYRLNLVI